MGRGAGRQPVGNNPVTISATSHSTTRCFQRTRQSAPRDCKNVGFVDVDGCSPICGACSFYGLTIENGYQKNGDWSDGSCIDDGYNWTNCPAGYCSRMACTGAAAHRILANSFKQNYGCSLARPNAQTANESIALLTTMLTTATQDLFTASSRGASISAWLESAGPQRGYISCSQAMTNQAELMTGSDDRYA